MTSHENKYILRAIAIGMFILIVLFEAGQQYYFVWIFDLVAKEEIQFSEFLKGQLIRWSVWLLSTIPLGKYLFKYPPTFSNLNYRRGFKYLSVFALTMICTLIIISISHMALNSAGINEFAEYILFFTFQKVPIFLAAYCGFIVYTLYNNYTAELNLQVCELSVLKEEYKSLYTELRNEKVQDKDEVISVKIGRKTKLVPLSNIVWIQSDDYCVRIHTADHVYSMRTSMNTIEQLLDAKGFQRIHRNAIINTKELEEITAAKDPAAILRNGTVLRIASSRLSTLKESISKNDIFG